MSKWFRAHNSIVNNRKVQQLPGDLFKAWINVLCLSSANDGAVPAIEDVAFALRVNGQRAAAILTQLHLAKLLEKEGDRFVPHDWNVHQFISDVTDATVSQRMKRYRERKRNQRNVAVTAIRPEAEAETETEQSRADSGAPNDEDLKRRATAIGAGISAHFVSRSLPIPNLDRCRHWLAQGYAQGTILGAIEVVLKRGTKPATLEYFDGAIADAHAKAPAATDFQVVSSQVFIVEGTLEWSCWDRHLRETTGRGSPVTDDRSVPGRVRRGWYRPTRVPEGYDEATGERIIPKSDEDAA